MKLVLVVSVVLWLPAPSLQEVLENDHVRVTVDPSKGGAVTSMTFKKATTFPLIAEHGVENGGRLYTNTSFLAMPRTGELWLSHGPPCKIRYTRYRLDGE